MFITEVFLIGLIASITLLIACHFIIRIVRLENNEY